MSPMPCCLTLLLICAFGRHLELARAQAQGTSFHPPPDAPCRTCTAQRFLNVTTVPYTVDMISVLFWCKYNLIKPSTAETRLDFIGKSAAVENELKIMGAIDDELLIIKRERILSRLDALFKSWIESEYRKKHGVIVADAAGGRVLPVGSYGLKVNLKGADIDAVCLAPRKIQRADFFSTFPDILGIYDNVTNIRVIQNASVPLIEMNLEGIEIDLLFANTQMDEIPHLVDFLECGSCLRAMDSLSAQSLSGLINNKYLEKIIERCSPHKTFALVLRVIKTWAMRRGIYGSIQTYLGGLSWSILVAKVCEEFPNEAPSRLIYLFFHTYHFWKWPTPIELERPQDSYGREFITWNRDQPDVMPILSLSTPQTNIAFNVHKSSLAIIKDEFKRGLEIVESILSSCECANEWKVLFAAPNFMKKYGNYIVISALGRSSSEDKNEELSIMVKISIKHLIKQLEKRKEITRLHFSIDSFSANPVLANGDFETCFLIGFNSNAVVNLTVAVNRFTNFVSKRVQELGYVKVQVMQNNNECTWEECVPLPYFVPDRSH